jgi:hypothetical protein
MDEAIKAHLANIRSGDRAVQGQAFRSLMEATEGPVDWAYEAWDDLLKALSHRDNHLRAIAAQVLCNLAKSDPEGRMLKDFDALLAVTRDDRFVTARHCLLSLWKIGATGPRQKRMLVDGLAGRFADCIAEKNGTLIRYDIIQGLRKLYDLEHDEAIRGKALELIETEGDPKYRKKYASGWRVR